MTSFLEPVARSASRHGSRPAFSSGKDTYTYDQFFAMARGIRDEIVRLGHGDAERIGVVAGDSAQTSASILSIWSLGSAFVPLNVHFPAERNARIIEEAGLDLILTSREGRQWPSYLPEESAGFRLLATRDVTPVAETLEFPASKPSDVAYLFFTSGSTGIPKGVPITHGNLSAFMETFLSGMGHEFSPEDRFLQMFELTFDLSIVSTLAPLSIGACCCAIPQKGIAYMNVVDVLGKHNVTVALMVPSILAYLRRFFRELHFPSLRLNQFCGEALTQEIVAEWAKCVPNARIENVYGPTEATIFCTRYTWERERSAAESVNGIVPIGEAMPLTRTLIVGDDGEVCEDGQRGELCLAGDQVMSGYWRSPEKTAAAFVETTVDGEAVRAYRTGDIAFVNENGNLVYCGRKDSQVKIDGHRIELGEIEFHARRFIETSAAAVVVERDSAGVNRLRLFVGGADIDRPGLEKHLKAHLPSYMWPSATTVLPELPLNLNGKIDRPALSRLATH